MGAARSCFYVVGSAKYSRCEDYAVYLVVPGRCYLLWAVETERNHHWGTVSNPILICTPDMFRRCETWEYFQKEYLWRLIDKKLSIYRGYIIGIFCLRVDELHNIKLPATSTETFFQCIWCGVLCLIFEPNKTWFKSNKIISLTVYECNNLFVLNKNRFNSKKYLFGPKIFYLN